ncbi:MAG: excalibur calcium-binding domain-containing protein [Oscillatoriales cyanobacterium SM2_1_8]|nr:excalibur calcium-binding domain-containing protein [Oscillatoriales cyanobacterium SM2_1_8]
MRTFWTISFLTLSFSTLVTIPFAAFAHGGLLNEDGCHTNRKIGDYHCHRGASPKPSQFSRQHLIPAQTTPKQRAAGAFSSCAEARAAGSAPVRRGDPGYGSHLDRDNDGIGCEPYRPR